MIRVRPLGLLIAIMFMLLGPTSWFMSSDRAAHTQVANSAISSILPDASSLGDQPRRGMVDAIETKQGWVVRIEHGRNLTYGVIVVIGLLGILLFRLLAYRRSGDDDL